MTKPSVWVVIEEHEYVSSDPVGAFSSAKAAQNWIAAAGDHEGEFAIYPLVVDDVRPHWKPGA